MPTVRDWAKYQPYFSKAEFDCKHTGRNEMRSEFMDRLLLLRIAYKKPMIITSGYRDKTHPVEERKTHSNGEHTQGMCCDVSARSSSEKFEIVKLALELGFTRIGFAKTFIHIGLGGKGLPTQVMWPY